MDIKWQGDIQLVISHVDNISRYVFAYISAQKSDVVEKVVKYKSMIEKR